MTISSGYKAIVMLAAVFAWHAASNALAEDYKWLKSQNYESIFVYTDLNGFESIEGKLNETVKRTFSRSNIKATVSSSMTFSVTDKSEDSIFELVDDELTGNDKIILHIYGKCIRYTSGFIYQFDVHFGVNNKKYSQALLYSAPHHSVVGVDTIMGIDSAFRELMKTVADDYVSANRQ